MRGLCLNLQAEGFGFLNSSLHISSRFVAVPEAVGDRGMNIGWCQRVVNIGIPCQHGRKTLILIHLRSAAKSSVLCIGASRRSKINVAE